jgi:hypothetical protein
VDISSPFHRPYRRDGLYFFQLFVLSPEYFVPPCSTTATSQSQTSIQSQPIADARTTQEVATRHSSATLIPDELEYEPFTEKSRERRERDKNTRPLERRNGFCGPNVTNKQSMWRAAITRA